MQARWTQTDPKAGKLTMPTSMNPYLYVGDDPVNGTDPTGQFSSIEVALLAETCAEFGGLAFAVTGNPVVGVVGCVVSVTAEAALTGLLDDLLL